MNRLQWQIRGLRGWKVPVKVREDCEESKRTADCAKTLVLSLWKCGPSNFRMGLVVMYSQQVVEIGGGEVF